MVRYAITDRQLFPGNEQERCCALVAQAKRLSGGGVDVIQLRERDLPERDLEALARHMTDAVQSFGETAPKILLNGPAHAAIAAGADGVHLRGGASAGELTGVREAFQQAGRRPPIVSVSCHSVEEVRAVAFLGVEYILFGPVFEKRVRGALVAPGQGLDLLAEACRQTSDFNILALGGITYQNAPLAIEAGAIGIAGIQMFL